jgi:hypothetical protein
LRRTLGDKNHSVDSDRLARVSFIVHTDGSCIGDKVGTGEAGRRNANRLVGCALRISGAALARHKAVPFRVCRDDVPAMPSQ